MKDKDAEYEVLKPFLHDRIVQPRGATVRMTAAQAEFLVRGGFVRAAKAAAVSRETQPSIVAADDGATRRKGGAK